MKIIKKKLLKLVNFKKTTPTNTVVLFVLGNLFEFFFGKIYKRKVIIVLTFKKSMVVFQN